MTSKATPEMLEYFAAKKAAQAHVKSCAACKAATKDHPRKILTAGDRCRKGDELISYMDNRATLAFG